MVVLLLAFAAIVVISKGSKRMPAGYTPLRSIPTAVLSGLTGALLLVNSVSNIFIYSVQINGTAPSGESTTPAGVIGLAMAIVGILAAFAIFLAAYGFATGTNPVGEHPLVALLPAVWGCICLVLLFISYTGQVLYRHGRGKERAYAGCDRTSGSTAGAFDLRADPADGSDGKNRPGAVPCRASSG